MLILKITDLVTEVRDTSTRYGYKWVHPRINFTGTWTSDSNRSSLGCATFISKHKSKVIHTLHGGDYTITCAGGRLPLYHTN